MKVIENNATYGLLRPAARLFENDVTKLQSPLCQLALLDLDLRDVRIVESPIIFEIGVPDYADFLKRWFLPGPQTARNIAEFP